MRPVATRVTHSMMCVCLSVICVFVLGTCVSYAKTAELMEMPFGGADSCGFKKPCIRWCRYPTGRGVLGGHVLDHCNIPNEVLESSSVWNEVQTICIWSSWCRCNPSISCGLPVSRWPELDGRHSQRKLISALPFTRILHSVLSVVLADCSISWAYPLSCLYVYVQYLWVVAEHLSGLCTSFWDVDYHREQLLCIRWGLDLSTEMETCLGGGCWTLAVTVTQSAIAGVEVSSLALNEHAAPTV